ncbi:MAG: MBL fold metallo-hydrolase [Spirochaetes bacterium]|nr:MBL fold metallo-hydrolase [Spirochaetota bacterium]
MKKTIVIILALTGLAFAGLRLAAFLADNRATDPADMVERYADADGKAFYRINAGINNSYLIPCRGGWLLVDTGYPDDYGRFKKALSVTGISPGSIKWLFITHAHDEHAGFAAALRRDSGCRLIVPEQSLRDLRAGQMVWNGRAVNWRIDIISRLYGLVKRRDMRFPPVQPNRDDVILVKDDRRPLERIGIRGTLVYTPGHSPDSWSLVTDDGRAFCGDAAMNFLNILGAAYRPIFITDKRQAYGSLRRLLSLGAGEFYTGHGPAFGKERIEEVLTRFGGDALNHTGTGR